MILRHKPGGIHQRFFDRKMLLERDLIDHRLRLHGSHLHLRDRVMALPSVGVLVINDGGPCSHHQMFQNMPCGCSPSCCVPYSAESTSQSMLE
jgi:hypothetical protein